MGDLVRSGGIFGILWDLWVPWNILGGLEEFGESLGILVDIFGSGGILGDLGVLEDLGES